MVWSHSRLILYEFLGFSVVFLVIFRKPLDEFLYVPMRTLTEELRPVLLSASCFGVTTRWIVFHLSFTSSSRKK